MAGAANINAVRLFEFGEPDKLVYGDYPMPEMGAGDALVKVLATSVSRWDVKYRSGEVHEFYGKATGHRGGIAAASPAASRSRCRCSSAAMSSVSSRRWAHRCVV